MNILFFGSAPTIGDGGIGAAILAEMRREWPDANFTILTSTPAAYADYPVCQDATIKAKPQIGLKSRKARLPLGVDFHLRYGLHLLNIRFFGGRLGGDRQLAQTLRDHFGWADIVVYQGGPGWNKIFLSAGTLRIRLLRLAAARHFGKPSVLYAQSFGPFDWRGPYGWLLRRLAALVLNQTQLITVRDGFSIGHLQRLGVSRPRLVAATDAAVRLPSASPERARDILRQFDIEPDAASRSRPLVGLSVRAIRDRYGYAPGTEARFHQELAEFLDCTLDELADVVFLSTDYDAHADHDNDLETMRKVQSLMQRGDALRVIDQPFLPHEIAAVYGLLDAFVGVRLHPVIFAVTQHTPVLSLGYAPKCRDFMRQMELLEWYIDYADFRADDGVVNNGVSKLRALLAQREAVSQQIAARLPVLQSRTDESLHAMRALVRQP